jgi:putative pyoverdin transport system ATP-binding/permease protein
MKLFLFYYRYSPRLLLLAVCIGALGGGGMAVLMKLINEYVSQGRQAMNASVWIFTGVVFLVLISTYISRALMLFLTKRLVFDLLLHLCHQIISAPLRKVEGMGSHRILAALTKDIVNLTEVFFKVPSFCIYAATIIGCTVYLWRLSPPILLFSALYFMLAIVSNYLLGSRGKRILRRAREDWDALVGHFQALTDGIKQLKLHRPRQEAFISGPLYSTASSYRRRSFKAENIYYVAQSWMQAQCFILIGFILFCLSTTGMISSENLISFTLVALFLITPISVLLELLPIFAQGRVSMDNVERLGLSIKDFRGQKVLPHRRPQSERIACSLSSGPIELIAVTHRYHLDQEERDFILGPVDLTLRAGELVFLAGGNGSGKTTLAKLLTGLYIPESGAIKLGGRLITDENRGWYNQHFAAIFSDFYLFDSLLGLETPDSSIDETAHGLLSELQLNHKVQIRNGVLSTINLSHGQQKRLALLTAILEDRPFYLFDEWAADQDPLFTAVFYLELLPKLKAKGKGVLVISHDDRYFHTADRVVKLEHGRLTHDQPFAHLHLRLSQEPEGVISQTNE